MLPPQQEDWRRRAWTRLDAERQQQEEEQRRRRQRPPKKWQVYIYIAQLVDANRRYAEKSRQTRAGGQLVAELQQKRAFVQIYMASAPKPRPPGANIYIYISPSRPPRPRPASRTTRSRSTPQRRGLQDPTPSTFLPSLPRYAIYIRYCCCMLLCNCFATNLSRGCAVQVLTRLPDQLGPIVVPTLLAVFGIRGMGSAAGCLVCGLAPLCYYYNNTKQVPASNCLCTALLSSSTAKENTKHCTALSHPCVA